MFYSRKLTWTKKVSPVAKILLPLKLKIGIFCCALFFLIACGPSYEELKFREESKLISDSVSQNAGLLANDTIDGLPQHFEQKAEIKLKVKNVLDASFEIEKLIGFNDGFIEESNLDSKIVLNTEIRTKADSLCSFNRYLTSNDMLLRVPKRNLDTVLKYLTGMAQFVDFKRIQTKDVKLKLYANQLAEKRYQQFIQTSKNHLNQGKKNQIPSIHESILEKNELSDGKRVESLELADRAHFSSIHLNIYQGETEYKSTRAFSEIPRSYEPNYLSKLKTAIIKGFELVLNLILLVIENWGLIFMLIVFIFSIRKFVFYFNKIKI